MNSKAVLILGNHANRNLIKTVSKTGFVPQVWGSMRHSLDKLQHQRFAGIIIDRKLTHADVLEFILNVRDVDKHIPVVVIGRGKDERTDRKIAKQNYVTIINGIEQKHNLAEKIANSIMEYEKDNVNSD